MPTINRDERLGFLFVDNKYELIGAGVTDWTIASNPKTSSKQYVHQKNASGGLSGYAPTVSLTGEVYSGDKVMEYLFKLGRNFDTGAKAHTKIVLVDLWTGTEEAREAVEYPVTISIDNPGSGPAGEALALTATLAFDGDGVEGKFNMSTSVFTKN